MFAGRAHERVGVSVKTGKEAAGRGRTRVEKKRVV